MVYTVPFTGDYEVTLGGSQGSAYSSNSGGCGYTLSHSLRLNYNDTIQAILPTKPTYSVSGTNMYVYGGKAAELYVNGSRVLSAGGGAGQIDNDIAPDDVTKVYVYNGSSNDSNGSSTGYDVHWHSGNGITSHKLANEFPTVYATSNPGGCYAGNGHTHNKTGDCPYDDHTDYDCQCTFDGEGGTCGHHLHVCKKCGAYVIRWEGNCTCPWTNKHDTSHGNHVWEGGSKKYMCGSPTNTWVLGCGKSNGQILDYANGSTGGCFNALATDPASINHSDNATAQIKLKEHRYLYYTGSNVSNDLVYSGSNVNLLLRDNIVIYYKRR